MFNPDLIPMIDKSINEALAILRRNMIKYHKSFPYQCARSGIYGVDEGFWADWHPGLYAGMFYLAYELCPDIRFKKYAESLGDILYNMISNGNIWHSDMGMVYLPCVLPDIKYNKSKTAKQIIVMASDCLVEKMVHGGRFTDITYFDPKTHRAKRNYYISQITQLCNIQLLSLASEISGNSKYASLAEGSMDSVFKYNISPDGKVMLRCSVNNDNLKLRETTHKDPMMAIQDDQRGFGWAIWNLAKCYCVQKKEIFLEKFELVLNYIEKNCLDDFLYRPNSREPLSYYDSSAAAISLCGLLEMSENSAAPAALREKCLKYAQLLFMDIAQNSLCTYNSGDECLIENGYKLYTQKGHKAKTSGTIPGDYFWLESLSKLYTILKKDGLI